MDNQDFLSLTSVFSYLNANLDSRCMKEGEQLLNAKHVILIGITESTSLSFEIFALCLQTSAMKDSPHEIRGKLSLTDLNVEIVKFSCTCKAGLSGTCKHIGAVLIQCTRSDLYSLEMISTTDVKCYWTNKKKVVEEDYQAKLIAETTCFAVQAQHSTTRPELSDRRREECFQTLVSACPNSSLACHLKTRTVYNTSDPKATNVSPCIKAIIDCANASVFLESLHLKTEVYAHKPCCHQIIKEVMDLIFFNEAVAATQRSNIWHQERQLRITGSRCYSTFTYSKGDWDMKSNNYFWPKRFSNKYVQHGIKYEKEALEKYKTSNNYEVAEIGIVICKQYPWIAYSPDGIVMKDGVPQKLVEIKCPYDGLENDAINFVHTCSFLSISVQSAEEKPCLLCSGATRNGSLKFKIL